MQDQTGFDHDSLKVQNGRVEGSAHRTKDGYTVTAGVISYEYERNGETRMNHVPNVLVTDGTGDIIREPHARDSETPERAIENAKQAAQWAVTHMIDDL